MSNRLVLPSAFFCSLVRRIIKERRTTDVPEAIIVVDVPRRRLGQSLIDPVILER